MLRNISVPEMLKVSNLVSSDLIITAVAVYAILDNSKDCYTI
jgi:hypothetical protein